MGILSSKIRQCFGSLLLISMVIYLVLYAANYVCTFYWCLLPPIFHKLSEITNQSSLSSEMVSVAGLFVDFFYLGSIWLGVWLTIAICQIDLLKLPNHRIFWGHCFQKMKRFTWFVKISSCIPRNLSLALLHCK